MEGTQLTRMGSTLNGIMPSWAQPMIYIRALDWNILEDTFGVPSRGPGGDQISDTLNEPKNERKYLVLRPLVLTHSLSIR